MGNGRARQIWNLYYLFSQSLSSSSSRLSIAVRLELVDSGAPVRPDNRKLIYKPVPPTTIGTLPRDIISYMYT